MATMTEEELEKVHAEMTPAQKDVVVVMASWALYGLRAMTIPDDVREEFEAMTVEQQGVVNWKVTAVLKEKGLL